MEEKPETILKVLRAIGVFVLTTVAAIWIGQSTYIAPLRELNPIDKAIAIGLTEIKVNGLIVILLHLWAVLSVGFLCWFLKRKHMWSVANRMSANELNSLIQSLPEDKKT